MNSANLSDIRFVEGNKVLRKRLGKEWGDWAAEHMRLENGFAIMAHHGDKLIGLISLSWQDLPPPLRSMHDACIDIIEVLDGYRRRGVARRLIEIALERLKGNGVFQVRAWSTEDKKEAIPMWQALGFSMIPVTHSMWGSEISGYFVAKRLDCVEIDPV